MGLVQFFNCAGLRETQLRTMVATQNTSGLWHRSGSSSIRCCDGASNTLVSVSQGHKNSTEDSLLSLLACCASFVISGAVKLIVYGVVEDRRPQGNQIALIETHGRCFEDHSRTHQAQLYCFPLPYLFSYIFYRFSFSIPHHLRSLGTPCRVHRFRSICTGPTHGYTLSSVSRLLL